MNRAAVRVFRTPDERLAGRNLQERVMKSSAKAGFLQDETASVHMPDKVYQTNRLYYRRAMTATFRDQLMNSSCEEMSRVATRELEQLKQEYQDADSMSDVQCQDDWDDEPDTTCDDVVIDTEHVDALLEACADMEEPS